MLGSFVLEVMRQLAILLTLVVITQAEPSYSQLALYSVETINPVNVGDSCIFIATIQNWNTSPVDVKVTCQTTGGPGRFIAIDSNVTIAAAENFRGIHPSSGTARLMFKPTRENDSTVIGDLTVSSSAGFAHAALRANVLLAHAGGDVSLSVQDFGTAEPQTYFGYEGYTTDLTINSPLGSKQTVEVTILGNDSSVLNFPSFKRFSLKGHGSVKYTIQYRHSAIVSRLCDTLQVHFFSTVDASDSIVRIPFTAHSTFVNSRTYTVRALRAPDEITDTFYLYNSLYSGIRLADVHNIPVSTSDYDFSTSYEDSEIASQGSTALEAKCHLHFDNILEHYSRVASDQAGHASAFEDTSVIAIQLNVPGPYTLFNDTALFTHRFTIYDPQRDTAWTNTIGDPELIMTGASSDSLWFDVNIREDWGPNTYWADSQYLSDTSHLRLISATPTLATWSPSWDHIYRYKFLFHATNPGTYSAFFNSHFNTGDLYATEIVVIKDQLSSVTEAPVQRSLRLVQHGASVIIYSSPQLRSESLVCFDLLGRECDRVAIPTGAESVEYNTSRLAPGIYFATFGGQAVKFVVR